VGQIGKIGQHDDALLRTAAIFDRREKQAKDSIRKATLRLSGKKTKESDTMKNEEYTQVLEQMILTLTGMKLEELHEAVGGRLSEDLQTPEREQETAGELRRAQGNARRKAKAWRPGTSSRAYKQEGEFDGAVDKLTSKVSQVEKERRSRNVFGLGGKKVAKPGARTMSKIKGQRTAQLAADQDDRDGKYMGTAEFSRSSDKATDLIAAAKKAKAKRALGEDYQTPARTAQMQDKYDRAEGKFFNNLSSDKLLRKVREIDNKNNAEQQSPRLYGKNGKIIPQTNKKRVRVGQPGGKQGGYQG
jgi:hypothetical protein